MAADRFTPHPGRDVQQPVGTRAGQERDLQQGHQVDLRLAQGQQHPDLLVELPDQGRDRRAAARPAPRSQGPAAHGQEQPHPDRQRALQAAPAWPPRRQRAPQAEAAQLCARVQPLLSRRARNLALEVLPVLAGRQGEASRDAGLGELHRGRRLQPVERPLHPRQSEEALPLRQAHLRAVGTRQAGHAALLLARLRHQPPDVLPRSRQERPGPGPEPAQAGQVPGRHATPRAVAPCCGWRRT